MNFRKLALGLSIGYTISLAEAAPPVPSPTSTPAPVVAPQMANPAGASFRFLVPKQRLWLEHSQVIAFQCTRSSGKQVFPMEAHPASGVEILQPPTVLNGETIGYLRVRALHQGKASLRIGKIRLPLDIVEDDADRATTRYNPVITSPMSGANVWGTITVGVELWANTPEALKTSLALRLPNREELQPVSIFNSGAHRYASFEVDADALSAGNVRLEAIARDSSGAVTTSDPLRLVVIRPDPASIIADSCAAQVDGPRPTHAGEKPPTVTRDPNAPNGDFVNNASANPPWCLPLEITDAGQYQMILTVRGDWGGGAFPSVGLIIDEEEKPQASVRLASKSWHRVPYGRPVFLEKGSHVLTSRFLNDFSYGKGTDRNLFLSNYEIVWVDSGAKPENSAAPMMENSMAEASPSEEGTMMASPMNPEVTGEGDMAEDPTSSGNEPLRVAFKKVFDGQTISGPVTINATAWWRTQSKNPIPAPRVDLWINGQKAQTQFGTDLVFRMPTGAFHRGANTLQLRARLPGRLTAMTPVQQLILPAAAAVSEQVPRYLRYNVYDTAWDASLAQRLEKGPKPTAVFYSNGESFLNLPEDLTGSFQVKLEARGQEFKGPPKADIVLRLPDQPEKIVAQIAVRSGWQTTDGSPLVLERGPKQLVVRFTNDLFQEADPARKTFKGDRNLWLKALRLEETPLKALATTPTVVDIQYPRNRQTVGAADAVVATAFSPHGLVSVDLLIDHQPQKLQMPADSGMGPILFPLLTRNLAQGRHTLQVVTEDTLHQRKESSAITFVVAAPEKVVNGPYQRALRLLNRFAYGPEPAELAAILILGEDEWLKRRLNETFQSPAEQSVLASLKVAFPNQRDYGQVVPNALRYLLSTTNPVRARFLMWTENHFSTWTQKAGAPNKWKEHLQFAELGPAPFADLLLASATSPAMLIYLDQQRSYANRLNENYAREIMELHTLGVHGGYTQTDVTTLAQQLNGWTLSEESDLNGTTGDLQRVFRFDPALNKGEARQICGMEFPVAAPDGRYDSVLSTLDLLAAHPSTARFISSKLAEQYVSVPAPPKLVDDLTKVFLETGGDMRALLTAIAHHPDFWSAAPKVATPLDFSIRFSRVCGSVNPDTVNDFLKRSAMGLFDRATPDGYPEADSNYADSNALLQRWRFSRNYQGNLNRFIPTAWVPATPAPVAGAPIVAPTPLDQAQAGRLVDLAAVRMTGQPLSSASYDASIRYLVDASANEPDRVKLVTAFISQTPELSLR